MKVSNLQKSLSNVSAKPICPWIHMEEFNCGLGEQEHFKENMENDLHNEIGKPFTASTFSEKVSREACLII